jgi:hypothetical protein
VKRKTKSRRCDIFAISDSGGRQLMAGLSGGTFRHPVASGAYRKVSQESVTSEPNNSSQDNHGGADYHGNGNKGREE